MRAFRNGMPENVAAGIKMMGKQFSMGIIEKTVALYAGIPRLIDEDEIDISRDIAYGDDKSQRLDVHVGKNEAGGKKTAVIMFVHGGGFIAGRRETRRHVANYFAGSGYVGVNMTHRLAPKHKWPDGGQDVGAAVDWVYNNISFCGGDPDRIFLVGESAGAFHVATYVFRPDVLERERPEVAAAVMISGPFMVDEKTANDGAAAYYGDDRKLWPKVAFPGNITRTSIPVLFTVAEYDPLHIDQGLALMIYELTVKLGVVPRFRQLRGHNHISGSLSIGTGDMMLTEEIIDLINAVASGEYSGQD